VRQRSAYFGPNTGWLETPVRSRTELVAPIEGPLIIEEYDSTCLVPPGATARLDGATNIIITLR
jgi:N-methylhydantoinase A